MSSPTKIAAFGALSVMVFTVALGIGAAVGPIGTPATEPHVPRVDMNHNEAGR